MYSAHRMHALLHNNTNSVQYTAAAVHGRLCRVSDTVGIRVLPTCMLSHAEWVGLGTWGGRAVLCRVAQCAVLCCHVPQWQCAVCLCGS
jgi:hypothetical protein